MNVRNAPKLNPQKLINDISALYGEIEKDQKTDYRLPDVVNLDNKQTVGLIRKCFRALYKIPLFGKILQKTVRVIRK